MTKKGPLFEDEEPTAPEGVAQGPPAQAPPERAAREEKPPTPPETPAPPKRPEAALAMRAGERGLALSTMDEMFRFATGVVRTGIAPRGDKAEDIMIKIQAGLELGIPPMRALSHITTVNGRLGIMGDLALSLIRSKGGFKPGTDLKVEYTGTEMQDDWTCTVTSWRVGTAEPRSHSYSIRLAKRARLFPPSRTDMPWATAPDRMLYYRALGFHCKDLYSDLLMGFDIAEDLTSWNPNYVSQQERTAKAPVIDQGPDPLFGDDDDADTAGPAE